MCGQNQQNEFIGINSVSYEVTKLSLTYQALACHENVNIHVCIFMMFIYVYIFKQSYLVLNYPRNLTIVLCSYANFLRGKNYLKIRSTGWRVELFITACVTESCKICYATIPASFFLYLFYFLFENFFLLNFFEKFSLFVRLYFLTRSTLYKCNQEFCKLQKRLRRPNTASHARHGDRRKKKCSIQKSSVE